MKKKKKSCPIKIQPGGKNEEQIVSTNRVNEFRRHVILVIHGQFFEIITYRPNSFTENS